MCKWEFCFPIMQVKIMEMELFFCVGENHGCGKKDKKCNTFVKDPRVHITPRWFVYQGIFSCYFQSFLACRNFLVSKAGQLSHHTSLLTQQPYFLSLEHCFLKLVVCLHMQPTARLSRIVEGEKAAFFTTQWDLKKNLEFIFRSWRMEVDKTVGRTSLAKRQTFLLF